MGTLLGRPLLSCRPRPGLTPVAFPGGLEVARMGRNIRDAVAADHRRLCEQIDRVRRGVRTRGHDPRFDLTHLALAHVRAVATQVYPAAERVGGQLRTVVRELAIINTTVEEAASALTAVPGNVGADGIGADGGAPHVAESAASEQAVVRLETALAEHVRVEEALLAALTDSVQLPRLRGLGGAYARSRDGHVAELQAPARAPRRLDAPRTDLYERARRAGITGRSAMSRQELIDALRHAQAG